MILEEQTLKAWDFSESRPEDEQIRKDFSASAQTGGGAADPGALSFEGHRRQFAELLDALENGRAPLVDGTEAKKSVQIVAAIYRSAVSGRSVHL